jgi:hypothetical protein
MQQFDLEIYYSKQMEKLKFDGNQAEKEKLDNDPLLTKGTGILGFRAITMFAVIAFLVLTLVATPIMVIYHNGTEQTHNKILKNSLFGAYTLGNLG